MVACGTRFGLVVLWRHLSILLLFNAAENAARFNLKWWLGSVSSSSCINNCCLDDARGNPPQPLRSPSPFSLRASSIRFLDRDGPLRWMDQVLDVDPPSSHGAARSERTRARFLIPGECSSSDTR
ncbi:hypothetical protein OPV22_020864 [Ensete ventricosum]|uniref:Secreted protein n=1 Tax=Ensete ventricosum TaxID=4639 RepID=A0AAV8QM95_ENSVE|nr:hypothetical protein OPV22_020864 [Ensete ventricosum]